MPTISPSSLSTSPLPPVYSPDVDATTYRNPIIFADYSDPDVIRVGDDFYLTASSFSCFPGLPILHSTDLIHWNIIGHAITHYRFDNFNAPQHGNGVWAPALRYHDGFFYIFFGDPDNGILMTRTKNPAGSWEPLHLVKAAKGWIDTCPFWDDDGQAYLVHAFARSRAGLNNRLDICKMSPDGTRLLDEGTTIFNGGSDPATASATTTRRRYTTVEGPKLYKRNGFYYVLAPGGGVVSGYQIAFRSPHILGPYESRIVLERGDTPINGPHQGGWVTTQTGEDWFIHFQDRAAYGRIVHLQPMTWQDDWPLIGHPPTPDATAGYPVLTHKKPNTGTSPLAAPQTSDEFTTPHLGLQWQWFANYQDSWADLSARPGYLRLKAVQLPTSTPLYNRPNLLLQKLPAEQFTITTLLDPSGLQNGDSAGLLIVGRSTASLTVRQTPAGLQLARTQFQFVAPRSVPAGTPPPPTPPQPPDTDQASSPIPSAPLYLRVHIAPRAICTFSYSTDGQSFTPLGQPFTASPDQWIGAKVGLFCNAPPPAANPPITQSPVTPGHADFHFFHFQ